MTSRTLQRQFTGVGIRANDVVMLHSSLSSLGFVWGGPGSVVAALREVLGVGGTLVAPTHTWEWMAEGLRVFDVTATRSCVGQLTEYFRLLPEARRSLHPTHSVAAAGPESANLITGHEDAETPCGEGTPYAKLVALNAKILFLGVDLSSNTMFHTLEALAGAPYLLRSEAERFELVDQNGQVRYKRFRRHRDGIARRFREQERYLLSHGALRVGTIAAARVRVLSALEMAEILMPALLADPLFFLADRSDWASEPHLAANP